MSNNLFGETTRNRPLFHLHPDKGLMNDPNGLIQFKGEYHVFYQLNPYGLIHKNKHWAHATSSDLVHWKKQPMALTPSDTFDKDGCYSGSAVAFEDCLYLFYTGNVVDSDGTKSSYQCLATSTDGIHFDKKGPIFEHPKGYTRHVRDPKVWQSKSGKWWLILGAQTESLEGTTLLYSSDDLKTWTEHGPFVQDSPDYGYMWECPDLLVFEETDVFVFSPQGYELAKEEQNRYPTGYMTGSFDEEKGTFLSSSDFIELDGGFEFYAPQTFVDEKKRRILFGWMGVMPDKDEESLAELSKDWLHMLTIPREVLWKQQQLYQRPVQELEALRGQKVTLDVSLQHTLDLEQFENEFILTFKKERADFSIDILQDFQLKWVENTNELLISRTNWESGKREYRKMNLKQPLKELRIFTEKTSIEIFVNEGQSVFSSRMNETLSQPVINLANAGPFLDKVYYYPIQF